MQKLYVGNLPFSATEDQVRALFAEHGEVESVNLITDQVTGRPRGFGFIEMSGDNVGEAVKALHGKELDGRSLKVSEAHPRRDNGGGPSR